MRTKGRELLRDPERDKAGASHVEAVFVDEHEQGVVEAPCPERRTLELTPSRRFGYSARLDLYAAVVAGEQIERTLRVRREFTTQRLGCKPFGVVAERGLPVRTTRRRRSSPTAAADRASSSVTENDPERRRALASIRSRLADRDQGVKVSEAAELLDVSTPTVRSWIRAGLLVPVRGASPTRVEVLNLAEVKRAVDLLRAFGQDRDLLSAVYRRLRDRDLLGSDDFARGLEDARAGRVGPIGDDLRKEMAELDQAE
jgi:hypothetical protein